MYKKNVGMLAIFFAVHECIVALAMIHFTTRPVKPSWLLFCCIFCTN
jgi:hypothetical protein